MTISPYQYDNITFIGKITSLPEASWICLGTLLGCWDVWDLRTLCAALGPRLIGHRPEGMAVTGHRRDPFVKVDPRLQILHDRASAVPGVNLHRVSALPEASSAFVVVA